MNERIQIGAKLLASHLILPLSLLLLSWFIKGDFGILLLITQTVLFILFLAGYWEFFGQLFRKYFSLSVQLLIILAFVFHHDQIIQTVNITLVLISFLTEIVLIILLLKIFLVIFQDKQGGKIISFPFGNGTYLITDGGNSRLSRLMNYHFHSTYHKEKGTNRSMLYAVDIVKMDKLKKGFLPPENEDYPVFGTSVLAPINGIIFKTISNIQDNIPFSGNYPYNTGNTIVIQHENLYFLLGHLKKDSILVKEGEMVQAGQIIASAGNSGWTERPHLHMQLICSDTENYWKGTGVNVLYKGEGLYKNRLIHITGNG